MIQRGEPTGAVGFLERLFGGLNTSGAFGPVGVAANELTGGGVDRAVSTLPRLAGGLVEESVRNQQSGLRALHKQSLAYENRRRPSFTIDLERNTIGPTEVAELAPEEEDHLWDMMENVGSSAAAVKVLQGRGLAPVEKITGPDMAQYILEQGKSPTAAEDVELIERLGALRAIYQGLDDSSLLDVFRTVQALDPNPVIAKRGEAGLLAASGAYDPADRSIMYAPGWSYRGVKNALMRQAGFSDDQAAAMAAADWPNLAVHEVGHAAQQAASDQPWGRRQADPTTMGRLGDLLLLARNAREYFFTRRWLERVAGGRRTERPPAGVVAGRAGNITPEEAESTLWVTDLIDAGYTPERTTSETPALMYEYLLSPQPDYEPTAPPTVQAGLEFLRRLLRTR